MPAPLVWQVSNLLGNRSPPPIIGKQVSCASKEGLGFGLAEMRFGIQVVMMQLGGHEHLLWKCWASLHKK